MNQHKIGGESRERRAQEERRPGHWVGGEGVWGLLTGRGSSASLISGGCGAGEGMCADLWGPRVREMGPWGRSSAAMSFWEGTRVRDMLGGTAGNPPALRRRQGTLLRAGPPLSLSASRTVHRLRRKAKS